MHAGLAGAGARQRRFAAHIAFCVSVVTFVDFSSFRAYFHRQMSSTAFRRQQLQQRCCSVEQAPLMLLLLWWRYELVWGLTNLKGYLWLCAYVRQTLLSNVTHKLHLNRSFISETRVVAHFATSTVPRQYASLPLTLKMQQIFFKAMNEMKELEI